MNSSTWMQWVIEQTWQVAVLASLVWVILRVIGRDRAHLAHLLWALVLVKCLMPPVWSSPVGLFGHLGNQLGRVSGYAQDLATSHSAIHDERKRSQEARLQLGQEISVHNSESVRDVKGLVNGSWLSRVQGTILLTWIIGSISVLTVSLFRVVLFLRVVSRRSCEVPSEVARCVERLNSILGLRQKVGVRVVDCLIGPAVYGLWRPTIVLPRAIIEGRSVQELEPLIAHELVHVRRGDLWFALIQAFACSIGWFHPMVWLASRRLTIESERCCDEETIARLRCRPTAYARSLLNVLEWKHSLHVAPALPGVRPVDITASRLERIMRLGQGCHRRSPWWVWSVALVAGLIVLPGARYVAAQPPKSDVIEVRPSPTAMPPMARLAEKIPAAPRLGAGSDVEQKDLIQCNVQILDVATDKEGSKKLLEWFSEHGSESMEGVPVLDSVPILSRLFKRPMVIVLSTDELTHFSEKIVKPMEPSTLSSPTLMTRSGSTGTVEVGCYLPEEKELADGFRMSITPTILESGRVRVSFEMTRTRVDASKYRNFDREKNRSTVELPASRLKTTVETSIELPALDSNEGQSFVIPSWHPSVENWEIVMVTLSNWSDQQGDENEPKKAVR